MLEIDNYITRAQHKIAELGLAMVECDEFDKLDLLLSLSDSIEALLDCYSDISELQQLKIAHYWSKEAELTTTPVLKLPTYKITSSVVYGGSGSGSVTWNAITGKPIYFRSKTDLVDGLSDLLDSKADKVDTYNKTEVNNLITGVVTGLKWKPNVATVEALSTTYSDAVDGWAAIVDADQKIYRFDGEEWVVISGTTYQVATQSADGLMSKADKKKLDELGTVEPKYSITIPVSLSNGKTLGKYTTGQTATYTNQTLAEILKDIAQENIEPSISLSTNLGQQEYNQINISPTVNISHTINTLGASLTNLKLERTRDSVTWIELYSSAGNLTSYVDSGLNPTVDNRTITYRLTVTDSAGASKSTTLNISFKAYVAPSMNNFFVGETSREKGDIVTPISGTVVRNSPNIALSSYKMQYKLSTGDWIIFKTGSLTGASVNLSDLHNNFLDNALINADYVLYRVVVTDAQSTDHQVASSTVNFFYKSYLGYSLIDPLTIEDIEGLGNPLLTNEKERTVEEVTSTGGTKTYYAYRAADGDLTNVIMDGAAPVLGALTKLPDISGVNSLGANVTYRIYESNATNAFSDNDLSFS